MLGIPVGNHRLLFSFWFLYGRRKKKSANGSLSYISASNIANLRGILELGSAYIFLVYDLEAVKGAGSSF